MTIAGTTEYIMDKLEEMSPEYGSKESDVCFTGENILPISTIS